MQRGNLDPLFASHGTRFSSLPRGRWPRSFLLEKSLKSSTLDGLPSTEWIPALLNSGFDDNITSNLTVNKTPRPVSCKSRQRNLMFDIVADFTVATKPVPPWSAVEGCETYWLVRTNCSQKVTGTIGSGRRPTSIRTPQRM